MKTNYWPVFQWMYSLTLKKNPADQYLMDGGLTGYVYNTLL